MQDDFDWSIKEIVVVPQVDAIAVYENPDGDIVIRQRDDYNDDPFVCIPRSSLESVITALVAIHSGEE